MTVHEERAIEIAREVSGGQVPVVEARVSARQGDVVLKRIDSSTRRGEATPEHGLVIAAGAHGEHRLIAPAVVILEDDTLDLIDGGILVHTDVPSGRHGAIRLTPGRWKVYRQRELESGEAVRVRD
ncbi:MAG: hypothetical protein QW136_00030 [Nitrososphaerales archaeon]